MENIVEINEKFDFNSIYLENPVPLQGGSFFTKINYSDKKLPLYIQLPKCKSKNGILKSTTSKKSYIDLLFNFNEEGLLSWFENLESRCRDLIFSKKDTWFQSDIELDDIESMFLTPIRSYKSGKFICLRSNIPYTKNIKKEYCMIYDETEKVLESSDVTEDKEIIPLVLVDGIRFTSKTFQLEINLPQLMVLNIDNNIKNNCMIRTNKSEDNIISQKNNNLNNENSIQLEKSDDNESLIENNKTLEKSEIIQEEIDDSKLELSKIENKDGLEEVNLELPNNSEEFSLKNPIEVYTEIYKNAKNKAKQLKTAAITAFLEAKEIKDKYHLEDSDNSDEEILIDN
tara:strand:+ start:1508 stop:2536 length:1029 start_codon:yes stop_codon:yes gene_type:complete